MIDQTNPHPIHSLPTSTISITSLSWHPTESVLACTLSSGTLLITRIGERSDGERIERVVEGPGDLVISNGYHEDDYDEYEDEDVVEDHTGPYDMTLDDSFASRRGEEMIVDEEDEN